MIRVYIAGPYTGDVDANCAAAIDAGGHVRAAGFCPFIPHLYRAWDARRPGPYQQWMDLCFEEVRRSDALFRMPGASPGADKEMALAASLGLPVFHSLPALVAWRDALAVRPGPHPLVSAARESLSRAETRWRAARDKHDAGAIPLHPEQLDAFRDEVGEARQVLRMAERFARNEPVAVPPGGVGG